MKVKSALKWAVVWIAIYGSGIVAAQTLIAKISDHSSRSLFEHLLKAATPLTGCESPGCIFLIPIYFFTFGLVVFSFSYLVDYFFLPLKGEEGQVTISRRVVARSKFFVLYVIPIAIFTVWALNSIQTQEENAADLERYRNRECLMIANENLRDQCYLDAKMCKEIVNPVRKSDCLKLL